MYLIHVTLLKKGLPLDTLTYFCRDDISLGTIMNVPFRKQTVPALVIGTEHAENEKIAIKGASFGLKPLQKDENSQQLNPSIIATAKAIESLYNIPLGSVIPYILPTELLYAIDTITTEKRNHNSLPYFSSRVTRDPLPERVRLHKSLIRESFAKDNSVVIVVPTTYRAKKIFSLTARGIEKNAILITGDTKKTEREKLLKKMSTLPHVLLVCTPSYAGLLCNRNATLILEDEGSSAYKTILPPHLDYRIVLRLLAFHLKWPLVLSDDVPSIETLYEHSLEAANDPHTNHVYYDTPVTIVSRVENDRIRTPEKEQRGFQFILPEVKEAIDKALQKKGKVIFFTSRKGLATHTICKQCKTPVACPTCSALMSLHEINNERLFLCPSCKKTSSTLLRCRVCMSWDLVPLGIGSEAVQAHLETLYPKVPLFSIASESVKTEKAVLDQIASFSKHSNAFLLTTERGLSYIDQDVSASLVVIVSLDSLYSIPNIRGSERILRTIYTLRSLAKEVMIQTYIKDLEMIRLYTRNTISGWLTHELGERQAFRYPPYTTIIKILFNPKHSFTPTEYRESLREILPPETRFEVIETRTDNAKTAVFAIIELPYSFLDILYKKESGEAIREIYRRLARFPVPHSTLLNPDMLM